MQFMAEKHEMPAHFQQVPSDSGHARYKITRIDANFHSRATHVLPRAAVLTSQRDPQRIAPPTGLALRKTYIGENTALPLEL